MDEELYAFGNWPVGDDDRMSVEENINGNDRENEANANEEDEDPEERSVDDNEEEGGARRRRIDGARNPELLDNFEGDDFVEINLALLGDEADSSMSESAGNASEESDVLEPNLEDEQFDKRLSATHSYLGQDLEAVDGNRYVVEEETTMRVPICTHHMVVVPGQAVPLTVFYPQDVMQLKRAREANKTLGFVFSADQLKPGGIGTTAVLRSYVDTSRGSYDVIRAILQGKQRFRVKTVARIFDGTQEADVVILPEWPASHPLDAYFSPALWRVGIADPWTEPSRVITTPARDATGRAFRFRIASPSTQPRHRLNNRYAAAPFAAHPSFVYRLYDHNVLIADIKKMFACWNTSWTDELPHQSHPVEFSYWLTQTMPVSEEIKFQLMSLPHYVQRLRACRSILKTSSEMVCETCGVTITSKQHLINFSDEGSCKAFVNPGGVVHEMLTVQSVSGVRKVSSKQTEHSWFPGYAWTIIQCSRCNNHLGWKFTATKKSLHPAKFWGITRKAVRPKFEDQHWRPVY